MTGGFAAQSPALGNAAAVFGSAADPILQQAERLQGVRGTAQTTGRDYAAQGEAYRQALTGPLTTLVRRYGERCISVSDRLRASGRSYDSTDGSGSGELQAAGGNPS
jgi:hypothetical protein